MAEMTTGPLLDAQRAADAEHAALRGLVGEEWDAQWARWREAAVKRAVRHPEA